MCPRYTARIIKGIKIGPSPDWDREDIPGDLYREQGKPPDLVAQETSQMASNLGLPAGMNLPGMS